MKFIKIFILLFLSFFIIFLSSTSALGAGEAMTAYPSLLNELGLNGASIKLVISGSNFRQGGALTPLNYRLNNAPPGLVISDIVAGSSTNIIYIILNFNGTNFDGDINNFSVTVLPGGTQSGSTVTSNSITIKDNPSVEGMQNYTVTGDSYPIKIENTGYNAKSGYIYINIDLYTTKTISSTQQASFFYFIKVYDQASNEIGSYGDYINPKIKSVTGSNTVSLKNIQIYVPNLPAGHRIVAIVKSVLIN